jgi:hypothetical protein
MLSTLFEVSDDWALALLKLFSGVPGSDQFIAKKLRSKGSQFKAVIFALKKAKVPANLWRVYKTDDWSFYGGSEDDGVEAHPNQDSAAANNRLKIVTEVG